MEQGRFGEYGGQFVPETVMAAVSQLQAAYEQYKNDPAFLQELDDLYRDYANRPSLLYYAEKMSKDLGGAKIYLKREDLNHTGAHKINNVLGQCLLAKRMGKHRIIAETGAGQHGVATATVCALMGMDCVVYMGKEDTQRQSLNVYRMELLGAKVVAVGQRHRNPEGRHQRSLPGLGHQHRHHLLLHRFGDGSPPLSHHGPGFPEGHRPGDTPAADGKGRPSAGLRGGLRRRRKQRDGCVL